MCNIRLRFLDEHQRHGGLLIRGRDLGDRRTVFQRKVIPHQHRRNDADGNQTSSTWQGNLVTTNTWTSFNQPNVATSGWPTITTSTSTSQFLYDQNHQRWKQIASYSGSPETTEYIGGLLEKMTNASGTTYRYYVPAGSNLVVYNRWSTGSNTQSYITKDHLGSSAVITDQNGALVVQEKFSATGINETAAPGTAANITRHQFTGQEGLNNVGLVNMNGRLYSSSGSFFLSPDPVLQDPTDTRSYNRYAYVNHNPLTFTDPTGFDAFDPNRDGSGDNGDIGDGGELADNNMGGVSIAHFTSGPLSQWNFASFGTETQCSGNCTGSPNYYGGLSVGDSKGGVGQGSGTQTAQSSPSMQSPLGESPSGSSDDAPTSAQANGPSPQGGPISEVVVNASRQTTIEAQLWPVTLAVGNSQLAEAFEPKVCQSFGGYGGACMITSQARAAAIASAQGRIAALGLSVLAPQVGIEALLAGATDAFSFFELSGYSSKVLQQMGAGVGEFHSFPESVGAFEDAGIVRTIVGGDGQVYRVLEIPGSYPTSSGRWLDGMFQFMQDENGIINHRLFVPGGP